MSELQLLVRDQKPILRLSKGLFYLAGEPQARRAGRRVCGRYSQSIVVGLIPTGNSRRGLDVTLRWSR